MFKTNNSDDTDLSISWHLVCKSSVEASKSQLHCYKICTGRNKSLNGYESNMDNCHQTASSDMWTLNG